VRGLLDERLGVPVPLEDDALGLVVVEVDVVLQRSGVLVYLLAKVVDERVVQVELWPYEFC
jgi:hypothetical protein